MKKYLLTIAASIFMALTSCQRNAELTDEQKVSVGKEVEVQSAEVISVLNQLDLDAWSEYWSNDGFISVYSGTNYFTSRSAWVDSVKYWWSLRKGQHMKIIENKFTVLAPNVVLNTGVSDFEILLKNGEQINGPVLTTLLWKKEESGWKIIHLHESWQ